MAGRVGAGRQAPGVALDEIVGALNLDASPPRRADDDVVARGQPSFAEHVDRDRHLILSREPAHLLYQNTTGVKDKKGATTRVRVARQRLIAPRQRCYSSISAAAR